MKSKPSWLTMEVRSTPIAATVLQAAGVLALWLLVSAATSCWLLAQPPGPVPGTRLAWGLVWMAVACAGVAFWYLRPTDRNRRWRLWLVCATTIAAMPAVLGVEAGLPSAAALTAWCGWVAWGGVRGLHHWLARRWWVRWPMVALVCFELLLQVVSAAVLRELDRLQVRDSHADYRILCLGDSFTFGIGASDRDHAWPAILQAKLRAALPGRSVDVINAGLPGQNSSTLREHLIERLAAVRPQVVVVCCGINNLWNLTDLDPAALSSLRRWDEWQLVMQQAALRVRLYRVWSLRGFRFQDGMEAPRCQRPPLVADTRAPTSGEVDIPKVRAFLVEHFIDGNAWAALCDAYFRTGRFQDAVDASFVGQRFAPTDGRIWRARVFGYVHMGSREAALQACADCLDAGCDPSCYRQLLGPCLQCDPDRIHKYLRKLLRDRPQLLECLPDLSPDFYSRMHYRKLLGQDLREMNEQCRAHGARMLIHSYPCPGEVSMDLAVAAHENGCPFVDHWPTFARHLESVPPERVYVADGHCTDQGYEWMAENLAPVVLTLLLPRQAPRHEIAGLRGDEKRWRAYPDRRAMAVSEYKLQFAFGQAAACTPNGEPDQWARSDY